MHPDDFAEMLVCFEEILRAFQRFNTLTARFPSGLLNTLTPEQKQRVEEITRKISQEQDKVR